MHMYWRVIEELKYLGEVWVINDPAISRRYRLWIQRHADSVSLTFGKHTAVPKDLGIFCQETGSIH